MSHTKASIAMVCQPLLLTILCVSAESKPVFENEPMIPWKRIQEKLFLDKQSMWLLSGWWAGYFECWWQAHFETVCIGHMFSYRKERVRYSFQKKGKKEKDHIRWKNLHVWEKHPGSHEARWTFCQETKIQRTSHVYFAFYKWFMRTLIWLLSVL